MKRVLTLLGVAGLASIITYLAVTRHDALRRSERLGTALTETEARLAQVESELLLLRDRTPPTVGKAAAGTETALPPGRATGPGNEAGAALTAPSPSSSPGPLPVPVLVVPLLRYTPTLGTGITSLVRIEGTSTIHDWQVQGKLIGGFAEFGPDFPENFYSLPGRKIPNASLGVFIPARSLASVEKDGSPYSPKMDDIMYEKLRIDRFPRITFNLVSLSEGVQTNAPAGTFHYTAEGLLAVAGRTNQVSLPVVVTRERDSFLKFTGAIRVRMTDFGITPPAPAIGGGVIKTGDEVALSFTWWTRPVKPAGN
jgi:hypothetical protein